MTVVISDEPMSLDDLIAIVQGVQVAVDDAVRARMAASRAVVDRALARDVLAVAEDFTRRLGRGTSAALQVVEEAIGEGSAPDEIHWSVKLRLAELAE